MRNAKEGADAREGSEHEKDFGPSWRKHDADASGPNLRQEAANLAAKDRHLGRWKPMAGDWIKVEKATARKPEVLLVADRLGIHPDHAFGLCVRFWVWCDDQMKSDTVRMPAAGLDSLLDHKGFTEALISVGWLRSREGAIEVPNFDRHLSQSSKSRADATLRQRKHRVTDNCDSGHKSSDKRDIIPRQMRRAIFERDGYSCRYCGWDSKSKPASFGPYLGAKLSIDHVIPVCKGGKTIEENLVSACSVCNMQKSGRTPEEAGMSVTDLCDKNVTKEKRREEKKEITPISPSAPPNIPAEIATDSFRAALNTWLAYKAERSESYKPTGLQQMLSLAANRAKQHGLPAVIAAMQKAMANGWKGWDQDGAFATSPPKETGTRILTDEEIDELNRKARAAYEAR